MTSPKKILSKILPRPLKSFIKRLQRLPLLLKVKAKGAQGKVVSKQDIIAGLRRLGIKPGDTIFVHSSFSSFGYVKRGPIEVIEALLEAVAPNGNVCMPSFGPLPDGRTFDVRNTPSAVGKIPEAFRKLPNAKRSLCPTHSIACIGMDAEKITASNLMDEKPFAEHSPYRRLLKMGGKVVCLGSPFQRSLTCNYLLEDELGDKFPVKVYLPNKQEFTVIDFQGNAHSVLRYTHDKSLDPIRVDWNKGIADSFEKTLEKNNCLKKTQIGEATVRVYGIGCMVETLRQMLKQGRAIYRGYGF